MNFDPTFGWKETIALLAAAFTLGGVVVGLLNYLLSRRSAQSTFQVETVLSAFDSRALQSDGRGRFAYYWSIDMTNKGGRTGTLRGLRRGVLPRHVIGLKAGKLVDQEVAWSMYVFDGVTFDAIAQDPKFLERTQPRTWEELGAVNIHIPAGETRNFSLALLVDNRTVPVDGYSFSLKLLFNSGKEYDLSTAVVLAGSLSIEQQ